MSLLFILSITSDLQTPNIQSFRGFTFQNEIILGVWNHSDAFLDISAFFAVIVVKFLLGLRMVIVCLVLIIKKRKSANFALLNNNQTRIIFFLLPLLPV